MAENTETRDVGTTRHTPTLDEAVAGYQYLLDRRDAARLTLRGELGDGNVVGVSEEALRVLLRAASSLLLRVTETEDRDRVSTALRSTGLARRVAVAEAIDFIKAVAA